MRFFLVLTAALLVLAGCQKGPVLTAEEEAYLNQGTPLLSDAGDHLDRVSKLLDQATLRPEVTSSLSWQRSFAQEIAGLNSAYVRYKSLEPPASLAHIHSSVSNALGSATEALSLMYDGIVSNDWGLFDKGISLLEDAITSVSAAESELGQIGK